MKIVEENNVVSIVGNAKNAGKTTVMNSIFEELDYNNIAITSIGLDGEETDQVTFMDKPRVYCKTGYLIATAEETLDQFEAEYRVIENTHIKTSIGNVKICEIIKPGNALIAGPSIISDMEEIIQKLQKYNLNNIFIDGAFFRHSLARVANASIFVVGANLSNDLDKVVLDAVSNVKKFNLAEVDSTLRFIGKEACICYLKDGKVMKKFDFDSVLGNTAIILDSKYNKADFLYLPLSLTNEFLEQLVEKRRDFHFDIIVNTPVNIQLNSANIHNLFKLKNKVYVLNPINLKAVCFNPYSPRGYEFDNDTFKKKLKTALHLKVINVMEGSAK